MTGFGENKLALGHTIIDIDDGMPVGVSDCEAYGMMAGCDEFCPVLVRGECEQQETDNKHLYELVVKE
jgi:hypothetical protein